MKNVTLLPTGLTLHDQERLQRRIGKSLSESTVRAYTLGWNQWREFANSRGLTLFPADPRSVAAFLDQRADTHSLSTVQLAKTAIAKMHSMANKPDPCADAIVAATMQAIRRTAPPPKQAKPLTAKVFSQMKHDLNDRDYALISVMRDGLLRVSETAALTWADIKPDGEGGGTVFIGRSKTDQTGQGAYQYIGPATLGALEYLTRGQPNERVFPLYPTYITRRIKKLALEAGLGEGYSGHSPRVGMAIDLSASGMNLTQLMQAGRWKSTRMPARYTEQVEARRGAVAQYYKQQGQDRFEDWRL